MTGAAEPAGRAAPAAIRTGDARRRSVLREFERFGLLIAWIAIIALFGTLAPRTFLSWANFSSIFGSQSVLVIATLGLIIPLTAGDLDLSVAQVLTLSSMTIAVLNVDYGWSILPAIGVAL